MRVASCGKIRARRVVHDTVAQKQCNFDECDFQHPVRFQSFYLPRLRLPDSDTERCERLSRGRRSHERRFGYGAEACRIHNYAWGKPRTSR